MPTKIFDLRFLNLVLNAVMITTRLLYYLFLSTLFTTGFLLTGEGQQKSGGSYQLNLHYLDKDSLFPQQLPDLRTSFVNLPQCADYINKIPSLLSMKGFPAASVDRIQFDTGFAEIDIYLGRQQSLVQLETSHIEKGALDQSGYIEKNFTGKPIHFSQLDQLKEQLLNYYEKTGYPFAAVFLDSITFNAASMKAILKVNKGPLYHIDSIRIKGKAKISNAFLQRYLGISNKSI